MSYDYDDFRPARVNSNKFSCSVCRRKFAAGHVPAPEINGPYIGRMICRDCRHALTEPDPFIEQLPL